MKAEWLNVAIAPLDETSRREAEARQRRLTKPPGSLGRMETLAIRLAAMQGTPRPSVDRVHITVFAADHGVAAEGVSAFPQSVTAEMIRNFTRGGAAISVLARRLDAVLEIINLGTRVDPGRLEGVHNLYLGPGTANFTRGAAMTGEQLYRALNAGRQAVERAATAHAQLYIGGDMGIGNTTAASALASGLLDISSRESAGPGTGLDATGVSHKAEVIRRSIAQHRGALGDPLETLRCLGGFEIAALTGSYLACAQTGLPALVDGFISGVAALTATRLCEGACEWFLFAHRSGEPGHGYILDALGVQPLLDLGMRLGEASGAAIAVPLLRLACALQSDMATFAEAGVSEKT